MNAARQGRQQKLIDDIIQKRIAEVLTDNPGLNRRVSQEFNVALLGTTIIQKERREEATTTSSTTTITSGKAEKKDAFLRKMALYRIIYSNPDLKAEIEGRKHQAAGQWLGDAPPISPASVLGSIFNSERSAATIKMNIWSADLCVGGCPLFACCLTIAFFNSAIWLIPLGALGYICCCFTCLSRRVECIKSVLNAGCVCCVCKLSTEMIRQQRDNNSDDDTVCLVTTSTTTGTAELCSNCRGTAVCQVGCDTCCPFIIPREDAIRRADIQRAVSSQPDLKKRFDTRIEDSLLQLARRRQGPEYFTREAKNNLILELVDTDPVLHKEIQAVVARLNDDDDSCCSAPEGDALATVLTNASIIPQANDVALQFEIELPLVHARAVLSEPAAISVVAASVDEILEADREIV